jgi:ABC-type sugar transport system substrate-binding protein
MRRLSYLLIGIICLTIGVATGAFLRGYSPIGNVQSQADRRYAIEVAYSTQPFFQEVMDVARKISSVVPGVQFVLGGPPDADSGKQIEDIDSLIARKVKGIILFPADPKALAPEINKSAESGVPVVTLFSDVPDSKRLTLVGAPERESAKLLAQRILDANPDFASKSTKVMVSFNKPGETVTDERLAGLKDVFESPKYRNTIELVQVVSDYGNDAKAAEAIAPVLAKHNDLKVIFGLNARSAIGAITALKESRNASGQPYGPGEVIVTGWDSDADVLNNIQNGWIQATSVLNSSLSTQIAFSILDANNLGYLYSESLQLRELSLPAVPKSILIPETFVDKTNVQGYRRKTQ